MFSGVTAATYSWSESAYPPSVAQVQALLASDTGRTQFVWPAAVNKVTMRRGGDRIIVLWDASPQRAIARVPVYSGAVTLYNKLGQVESLPPSVNGSWRFALERSSDNTDPRDPSLYLVGGSPLLLVERDAYATSGDVSSSAHVALPSGHFFQQANGRGGAGTLGFTITDARGVPFWSDFRDAGGESVLGYPSSRRFEQEGFIYQATQRELLQWAPGYSRALFANVFDELAVAGKDPWLQAVWLVPPSRVWMQDRGKTWVQVEQNHLALLDGHPVLKRRYFANPQWLQDYGLPMALANEGPAIVLRCQRAVFQHWLVALPGAGIAAGTVTMALGGDMAKAGGLIPLAAALPMEAPWP